MSRGQVRDRTCLAAGTPHDKICCTSTTFCTRPRARRVTWITRAAARSVARAIPDAADAALVRIPELRRLLRLRACARVADRDRDVADPRPPRVGADHLRETVRLLARASPSASRVEMC